MSVRYLHSNSLLERSALSVQENATDYAVYHSVHDNFYWMSHFGDPDFTYHVAMGLVWMKTAVLLTTTPLLPYDPRHFGFRVTEIFGSLTEQYANTLKTQNISLSESQTIVVSLMGTYPVHMNQTTKGTNY